MANEPWLGKPASFRQAHPSIQSLRLEAVEHGEVQSELRRTRVYTEANIPATIPCGNPRCRRGGYDLTGLMIALEHGKQTSYQQKFRCNGQEGTPSRRARVYPCENSMEVSIHLTYKE